MMKRYLQHIAFAAVFLFACSAGANGDYWRGFERGRLPKIDLPAVDEEVLRNGMRAFILEDHTLPAVWIKVLVKVGGNYEPADKVGLATLTGMLMRSGGAGGLSPQRFDEGIDNIGATVEMKIGREEGDASLDVLSSDLEEGLKLLFDMLFDPGFDPGRLRAAKAQVVESLLRENDDPGKLSTRKFKELVYGPKSPWARISDKRTLDGIGVDDIRAFHTKYFKTDNMIISVAGDFDKSKLVGMIEEMTRDCPRGEIDFPKVEEVVLAFDPGVELVARPISQAFIRVGHLGIKRHNPDKFSLIVMSDILGAGNFKSRLMEDIRSNRGLAYSVWSEMAVGSDYGLFVIGVTTRKEKAAKVIDLVREHIVRLTETEVSQQELDFAKQSNLASIIFGFDNSSEIVNSLASFYYYGYPRDYLEVYQREVDSVSSDSILEMAKKYLHPDGLKIVVVAPKGLSLGGSSKR